MKFEIQEYKGQTIEYDDDDDKFLCDISIEDKNKTVKRASLSYIRKEIDQFIKLNAEFKAFECLVLDKYDSKDFEIINVLAIRTDGKFITHKRGNESYKSHSGKKDTKYWMVYDADIVQQREKLRKDKDEYLSSYHKSVKKLCDKLTPIDLSQYEHIINPE